MVARRRGFVAGFSETHRKIPAPSCEKLPVPSPSEHLLLKAHTLPFLFTLFSNLSFAEEAKLNWLFKIVLLRISVVRKCGVNECLMDNSST